MTCVVSSDLCTLAPSACTKEVKAAAVVLTVPDAQDSGEVDDNGFLTLKKRLRFRRSTEIVQGDASTASSLVECEPWDHKNWLYRPSASETAGARYQAWWGWYLYDKDRLLCKQGCQFWWGVCVERRWTTLVDEVTL